MPFFKSLAVGLGLDKRDTIDNSELKNRIKRRRAKEEAKAESSFTKAGSIYDSVNAQREHVQRKALLARQRNTRGLSPEFQAQLKEQLLSNQEAQQQVAKNSYVKQQGESFKDKAEDKVSQYESQVDSLTKQEQDDKRLASSQRDKALIGTVSSIAKAVAGVPSIGGGSPSTSAGLTKAKLSTKSSSSEDTKAKANATKNTSGSKKKPSNGFFENLKSYF